jgi:hypothetical protein
MAIPIGNSDGPTQELGYVIPDAGFLPGWAQLAADDLEDNQLLLFPENIRAYTKMMKTDSQIQGLSNGCLWPIFRMRFYLDKNNCNDKTVTQVSEDFNLPVGKLDILNGEEDTFPIKRTQNRFKFLEHLSDALQAVMLGVTIFEQSGFIGEDERYHLTHLRNRPATTIAEAKVNKDGMVEWIKQHGYREPNLDIDRLVLYSFQKRGGNWTGQSMLRACYGPWLLKDRAMRIGVMNLQRAGVGTPVIEAHQGASDAEIMVLNRMAENWKGGDRSGGAVPFGAKVRLVGVEGSQPDSIGFVKLMNEEMARAFLQMFMQLGQSSSGSRALGSAFIDWHKMTLEYIANWFCDIFNEHVIEDIVEWNDGESEEYAPRLRWQWNEDDPEASAQDPTQKLRQQVKDGKVQAPADVKAWLDQEHEEAQLRTNSRRDVAHGSGRRATRGIRSSARPEPPIDPEPGPSQRRNEIEVKLA